MTSMMVPLVMTPSCVYCERVGRASGESQKETREAEDRAHHGRLRVLLDADDGELERCLELGCRLERHHQYVHEDVREEEGTHGA